MSYFQAKLVTCLLFALPGLFALALPTPAAKAALVFPRHKGAGRVLSAVAFIWAACIVYFIPLDFLAKFRLPLVALLVVSIPLSWRWMPDLLAARALGGLWCLLPAPVLLASRFAESGGRLVVVTLMYVVAVAGMISAFSPYYLRDVLFFLAEKPASRMRAAGAALLVCGIAAAFA